MWKYTLSLIVIFLSLNTRLLAQVGPGGVPSSNLFSWLKTDIDTTGAATNVTSGIGSSFSSGTSDSLQFGARLAPLEYIIDSTSNTSGHPMYRPGGGSGPSDAWTISLFFYLSSNTTNQTIFLYGPGYGSNQDRYHLYYNSNGLVLFIGDNYNNLSFGTPSGSIMPNKWYHVVVTYNGQPTGVASSQIANYARTFNLYLWEGEDTLMQHYAFDNQNFPANHTNYGTNQAITGPLYIGHPTSPFDLENARVDELSIWDKDLSIPEVKALRECNAPADLNYHPSYTRHIYDWWVMGNHKNSVSIGMQNYISFIGEKQGKRLSGMVNLSPNVSHIDTTISIGCDTLTAPQNNLGSSNYNSSFDFDGDDCIFNPNPSSTNLGTAEREVFYVLNPQVQQAGTVLYLGEGAGINNTNISYGLNSKSEPTVSSSAQNGTTEYTLSGQAVSELSIVNVSAGNNTSLGMYDYSINGGSMQRGVLASGTSVTPTVSNQHLQYGARKDASGQNENFLNAQLSEVLFFDKKLSTIERKKINSYLALKHGLTLGDSYYNSNGTEVYNTQTHPYRVIGLARDDNGGLLQKQSKDRDDSIRIFIVLVESSNMKNPATPTDFGGDTAYVMIGDNNGELCSQNRTITEKPLGTFSRLDREWKVENTNFTGNYNLDVRLHSCSDLNNVNPSDLNLLVDDDGDFSDAQIYSSSDGLTFNYSNGLVTVKDINSNIIPVNANSFITLGSSFNSTLFPLEILSFSAEKINEGVHVNWEVVDQEDMLYYEIERSSNGVFWNTMQYVEVKQGKGVYQWIDYQPSKEYNYYRIKCVDKYGLAILSAVVSVYYPANEQFVSVFPNPIKNNFQVYCPYPQAVLWVGDLLGNKVKDLSSSQDALRSYNLEGVEPGVYLLHVHFEDKEIIRKILLE